MDLEKIKETRLHLDGLSNTLGMEFISTPEPDTCQAKMKVDEKNRQVFGFLSGGASLALAENLAGVGSMALCPDKICVGINVSGSHVKAVMEGGHRYCHSASPPSWKDAASVAHRHHE